MGIDVVLIQMGDGKEFVEAHANCSNNNTKA